MKKNKFHLRKRYRPTKQKKTKSNPSKKSFLKEKTIFFFSNSKNVLKSSSEKKNI